MHCMFVNKWYCSIRIWNLGISFLSLVKLAADTALEFLQPMYTEKHGFVVENPEGC